MRLDDRLTGALLLALAIALLVYAMGLPPMPGQRYGAAAFPTVVALGLGLFSVLLIWQGWRTRRPGAPLFAWAGWVKDSRNLGNFLLSLALVGVYVAASDKIGFIPLSLAILFALFVRQGVTWGRAAAIAALATAAIQYAFASLLRVPLPRGLLDSIL
ncbi:MAG: tripartite tricarboxylate transporter TctB family protein [Alphaproteobacteria bacterium]|nr:tripartite tricarboxylate transporter TctB family protein [Alphaproteobacteria bacterium]